MGIKISDLPNINLPYNGSEEFPIVQGGVTKAAPLSTISNFLSAVLLADSELAVLSGVWQASYTSLTATSGNWNRGYTAFTFLTATSGAYQAAHTKMTTSSAAYDNIQTKFTTSSAAYDATQTKMTTSSAAYDNAHSRVSTSSASWVAATTKITASSAAYDATQTKMTTSSAAYDNVQTKFTTSSAAYDATQSVFTTNSGTYATRQHVHNGFFPLTGNATVTGPARFNSDVTVLGSLSVAGSASFVNTLFSTSSALSVVGNLNTGPVFYVGANGSGDIASFYDTDQNIEVLHVGGHNGTFPNVGVKTSTPNVDFTVSGDISARSIIYDRAGDSVEWNTAYTVANASSASWIAATTKITASSGAYDATVSKVTASSGAYDATQTKFTTSSAAYDNAQTIISTTSATWNQLNTNMAGSSALWTDTYTKFSQSSASGASGTTKITASSGAYDATVSKVTASSGAYDATVSKVTASSGAYDATVSKVTASSGAYDATQTKMTTSSAAYDNVQSVFSTNSALYILSGGNTTNSILTIGTRSDQPLEFDTNNVSAMTILSTGNIVMATGGVAAPLLSASTSKLAVSGDVTVYGSISTLSGIGVGMGTVNNVGIAVSAQGPQYPARVRVQGKANQWLDLQSWPNDVNYVIANGQDLRVGTQSNNPVIIYHTSQATARFDNNHVGIGPGGGVSPPTQFNLNRLSILGSMSATGSVHSDSLFVGFTGMPPTNPEKLTVNGNISALSGVLGTSIGLNTPLTNTVNIDVSGTNANAFGAGGIRIRGGTRSIALLSYPNDVNYINTTNTLRIAPDSIGELHTGSTRVGTWTSRGFFVATLPQTSDTTNGGFATAQAAGPFVISVQGGMSAAGNIYAGNAMVIGLTSIPTEKLTVNGNISSNGTITGTNLVYNTGDQTIAGGKTFSGQLEATGQAATADTSIMTRGLTDTRFGTPYFLCLTNGVSANSTLFTSGVQTITLPAGVYQYESMVLASTGSTTAGANYVLSASRDDTRITSTTERIISNTKNIQGTSTTLPLYGSQLFNTALSGSFDSTRRQGSLVSHGVVVFETSTTITPRVAQLTTTDASNAAVLEAGSYISFFKRG
jgi:hypothetical protein